MVLYKTNVRRRVFIDKRDIYGLTSRDVIDLHPLLQCIIISAKTLKILRKNKEKNSHKINKVKHIVKLLAEGVVGILRIEDHIELDVRNGGKKKKEKIPPRTVHDFSREGFSDQFRFHSPEDILRLITGLGFPPRVKIKRYSLTAEEIVLISLKRLAYPLRWSDIKRDFPGRCRTKLRVAFFYFLDFMIANWGYLILNNREYWVEKMADQAEAIRIKLANLPWVNWRLQFPPANQPGGFNIFAFIDNTMIKMCRPGGGPLTDGEAAPRLPKEIQQAWWTGWKKLHGMKWQSVTMANGMDFEIWGPVSVRHPDAFTLNGSAIEEKLAQCQEGRPLKFKMYGDSAYFDDEFLATGGGRGMSSVRESVEWGYKDLKTIWKVCDWRNVLKLRDQPVAKIMFVCFLLKNIHTTFYACQTAVHFLIQPPTFEDYISQGPKAHPIPNDIIFSDNYEGGDLYDIEISDAEDDDGMNEE
jgi:hypothetical protein